MRIAATVAAAVAAALSLAAPALGGPVNSPRGCVALRVESPLPGQLSRLVRVELPSGTASVVRELDHRVNAIGYADAQDVVYGIASRDRAGWFQDGGHVVTIKRDGQLADLGPVRGLDRAGPFAGAVAGTVAGTRLYLRERGWLYAVSIDPAEPSYLSVVHAVRLLPHHHTLAVDDFAVDPADGMLYGVSTGLGLGGLVVRIDPVDGSVHPVPIPGLPLYRSSYASVVIAPDRTLYAWTNGIGSRSRLYRIPLDGSGPITESASRPAVTGSDAAGCLTVVAAAQPPPPPEPTPPPPPPTPLPTPSPEPTPPPTSPQPAPPPPPAPAPPPRPAPPPVIAAPAPPAPTPPPRTRALSPPPTAGPRPSAAVDTEDKRRWGLTVLLLVVGAGAVARMAGRHR